jgi:molecular chaperone IbpA
MRNLDLAPLWRSTIGFDRLFDLVEDSIHWNGDDNFPHYDIVKTGGDRYAITLALAGFSPEEITITAEQNTLTVEGRKTVKDEEQMLYRGISTRAFRRTFSLADFMQVQGASFENGLLKIDLVREVPEAMKPRTIAIGGGAASNDNKLEHKKAA